MVQGQKGWDLTGIGIEDCDCDAVLFQALVQGQKGWDFTGIGIEDCEV